MVISNILSYELEDVLCSGLIGRRGKVGCTFPLKLALLKLVAIGERFSKGVIRD